MSHSHPTDSIRLDAHFSRSRCLRKIYHLMSNWSKNGTKYRILNFLNHQNETVSGRAGASAFNEFAFSLLSYVPYRQFIRRPLLALFLVCGVNKGQRKKGR